MQRPRPVSKRQLPATSGRARFAPFAQSRQQGPGDAGCRPRWDVPAMALDEARGEKGAACTVSLPVSGCDQPGAGGRGGEKVPATILLEVRVTSLCPEPSGVTARPKDPALDWPAPGFLHPTTGFSRSLERSAPFEFVQSSLWCLLRGLMEGGPGQTESQTCNDGFSGIAQFFRDGQSRSYGGSVVMSALSVARSGVRPICHWCGARLAELHSANWPNREPRAMRPLPKARAELPTCDRQL